MTAPHGRSGPQLERLIVLMAVMKAFLMNQEYKAFTSEILDFLDLGILVAYAAAMLAGYMIDKLYPPPSE